jgi:hypothetical protein
VIVHSRLLLLMVLVLRLVIVHSQLLLLLLLLRLVIVHTQVLLLLQLLLLQLLLLQLLMLPRYRPKRVAEPVRNLRRETRQSRWRASSWRRDCCSCSCICYCSGRTSTRGIHRSTGSRHSWIRRPRRISTQTSRAANANASAKSEYW